MSITRRNRRAQERLALKRFNVLGDLLMGFYAFLEKSPKPSDEEVRSEFIWREQRWKQYCKSQNMTVEASQMFNKEVSASWEKRYKKELNDSTTK